MRRAAFVSLALALSILSAVSASAQTCPNPIDNPPNDFFVNQQYRDFLFRNANGFELASGVAPINSCYHAGNLACADRERVLMSRSMWDRPEFRQQSRTFGLGLADYPLLYNNEDFVLLCYYIYLQRAPNAAPDYNYDGYNFWLGVLNNCTEPERLAGRNGNECYNQIINAFLKSIEYRARFGCT